MPRSSILRAAALSLAASVASLPALAADQFEERYEAKPAVSGFNGKIGINYSWIDLDPVAVGPFLIALPDAEAFSGEASFSAPIGQRFGVQVDLGYSNIDFDVGGSISAFGAGAHIFWRDPDKALVGIYGDVVRLDDIDTTSYRIGVEAELYLDRFSIEGFAGAQFVSSPFPVFSPLHIDDGFTGDLTLAYYPIDDLRLSVGVAHVFEETFANVGAEWQANFNGFQPTFTVNGRFGDVSTEVTAGLRFYFGQDGAKSLIRRHREDDPRQRTTDAFFGASQAGGLGACRVPARAPGLEKEVDAIASVKVPGDGYGPIHGGDGYGGDGYGMWGAGGPCNFTVPGDGYGGDGYGGDGYGGDGYGGDGYGGDKDLVFTTPIGGTNGLRRVF